MHRQVSNDAVHMHLLYQHPRLEQLQQNGLVMGPGSPDCDPNAYLAERNSILGYVFFSQAKPPAEKQELMRDEREKYKHCADRGLSCGSGQETQFRATSGEEPVMKEKVRFLGLDVHAETRPVTLHFD